MWWCTVGHGAGGGRRGSERPLGGPILRRGLGSPLGKEDPGERRRRCPRPSSRPVRLREPPPIASRNFPTARDRPRRSPPPRGDTERGEGRAARVFPHPPPPPPPAPPPPRSAPPRGRGRGGDPGPGGTRRPPPPPRLLHPETSRRRRGRAGSWEPVAPLPPAAPWPRQRRRSPAPAAPGAPAPAPAGGERRGGRR